MMKQDPIDRRSPGRFRFLMLATAITLFILIVTGGIVRVTESTGACPDWPTCFGQWTPPVGDLPAANMPGVLSTGGLDFTAPQPNAFLDYLHRLATFAVTLLLLIATSVARKRYHHQAWISRPLYAALGLLAAQIVVGAILSIGTLQVDRSWISAAHLIFSLFILASVVVAGVVSFYQRDAGAGENSRLVYHSPFARLSLLTLAALFLLLVSGLVVAGAQATTACTSWPLCDGGLFPQDAVGWIHMSHRLLVAITGVLMVALMWKAWRTQRTQIPILVATTATVTLFYAQALMGAKLVIGFPAYLLVLHESTAVAVWAVVFVLLACLGLAQRTAEQEQAEAAAIVGRRGLLKDFLMLTKPVVVALLLVTTYAGMVIGAQAWPSFPVAFWTLLGGFLAAGGSGAINQYIDRYDDFKMQRTQKRPIPAGRLTPGEGLAFGVAISLASFYFMVAFVNFLAALLTLAGIIYYVLLYSIVLKKTTVQNIVIGGGAGAIPPLVGWAAATGSLNVPALFLFAVIFMWTPPHFWALALVRRNDYARAGVPMLPVVRGEQETRWQIFIYTVELVGLTLLLPLFGLGGSLYLIGAIALGGWLLTTAWRVWKRGGNKQAWKMYRYSSMYLAFLFMVLMIDRLM